MRLINKSLSKWLKFESGRSFKIEHIQEDRFVLTLIGFNQRGVIISSSAIIEERDSGISAGGSMPNVIDAMIASWLKKVDLPA